MPEYLPAVPGDPWGRPYIYLNNGKQPLLVTFGQDGERGGQGIEQDHNQHDGHVALSCECASRACRAAGGSGLRCWGVSAWRICRAAVSVALSLAE